MPPIIRLLRTVAITGLLALAGAACAHDTWFEPRGSGARPLIALGTGNQFPLHETGIDVQYVESSGCLSAQGRAALRRVDDAPAALLLEPMRDLPAANPGASCWAQLAPFTIEIEPALVRVYLDEINAPAAVRAAWAAMQARGEPWRERYTKHARIELPGGARTPAPVPMAMDLLLDADAPIAPGQRVGFTLLRDGAPLPGQAVELRHERAQRGVWLRTDDAGRASAMLPLAGHWLLRATDLRRSDDPAAPWESRFLTLAFQVGNTGISNARSTNQAAATSAITIEPPTSTARR
jgi:hypothetical protein